MSWESRRQLKLPFNLIQSIGRSMELPRLEHWRIWMYCRTICVTGYDRTKWNETKLKRCNSWIILRNAISSFCYKLCSLTIKLTSFSSRLGWDPNFVHWLYWRTGFRHYFPQSNSFVCQLVGFLHYLARHSDATPSEQLGLLARREVPEHWNRW